MQPEGKAETKEIRVQVKLLNAGDEALVRRGLLSPEQVRSYIADAIVDPDLYVSVLPSQVVRQLGLTTIGKVRGSAIGVARMVEQTEIVTIDINGRRTVTDALVAGSEVVIGRIVLAHLDLVLDRAQVKVVPNPAHPDGPVFRV